MVEICGIRGIWSQQTTTEDWVLGVISWLYGLYGSNFQTEILPEVEKYDTIMSNALLSFTKHVRQASLLGI